MVNIMTADQIRGVVFQTSAIGGYKKADVDLFIEEIAVCIESMTSKIRALEKAKFDAMKQNSAAPQSSEPEVEEKPQVIEEIKPQIPTPTYSTDTGVSDTGLQALLIRAQKLAEQIELEAHQAAEELLNKTANDAKEIIARADAQAEDTLEKANSILAEAERKEASMRAAAHAEAENIINEAVARSGQMLTSTREKLKSEQAMCEKLRLEFSQVRNVIVGFYEEQLQELRGIDLESVATEITVEEPADEVEFAFNSEEAEEPVEAVDEAAEEIEEEAEEEIIEEVTEEEPDEEDEEASDEEDGTEIQLDLLGFSEE